MAPSGFIHISKFMTGGQLTPDSFVEEYFYQFLWIRQESKGELKLQKISGFDSHRSGLVVCFKFFVVSNKVCREKFLFLFMLRYYFVWLNPTVKSPQGGFIYECLKRSSLLLDGVFLFAKTWLIDLRLSCSHTVAINLLPIVRVFYYYIGVRIILYQS